MFRPILLYVVVRLDDPKTEKTLDTFRNLEIVYIFRGVNHIRTHTVLLRLIFVVSLLLPTRGQRDSHSKVTVL